MKKMAMIFILVLVMALLLPGLASADEFSGSQLREGWYLVGSEKTQCNLVNGVLGFMVPRNEEAYLLRNPKDGDWQIDVQFSDTTGRNDAYLHGLALYADAQNHLVFGKGGEKLALRACIDGQVSTLFTCADDAFIKIRKVIRGAAYATYYFYSNNSQSSQYNWQYRGCFEDTDHLFDDADYGLYGTGSKKNAAVYDYFTEAVLDYDLSCFPDGGKVDGVWQTAQKADALVSSAGGSLKAVYKKNEVTCAVLRAPIQQNYRIQTKVDMPGLAHGLMVWQDAENYLMLTPVGVWACRDGTEEKICDLPGENTWLRITKVDGSYTLDTSADGMNFATAGVYQDTAGRLDRARYGFGAKGAQYKTATYYFMLEMKAPNGVIWDTAEYRYIGRMIGAEKDQPLNETFSSSRLRSGDLGCLTDAGDRVYLMHGDSFSGDGTGTGDWRSNVLAIVEDDTPADGLDITKVFVDQNGLMKEMITARHMDYDEVTCIPNYGIYIDDVLYYQYMSVFHWGIAAHWDCNYAGWAWSADGGETWERMENFFDADSNFMICSLLRQDGYLYLYGIPSAKFGSVHLARVPEKDILNRSAYTFFAGLDGEGNPVWSTEEKDAKPIVEDQASELSVVYNEALGCYMMAYMNEYSLNMVIRDAGEPWGQWSNPVILTDHMAQGFRYGPYMLERYIEEDGTRLYFMATNSARYFTTWNSVRLIVK